MRPAVYCAVVTALSVAFAPAQSEGPTVNAHRDAALEAAKLLMVQTASDYSELLPAQPLSVWLDSILPRRTTLIYELNDCGEQTGNPEIDHTRDMPICLGVEAVLLSRARKMALLFDKETLAFRSGFVFAEELDGTAEIDSLTDLNAALEAPLRPIPLVCEGGTTLKLRDEQAGRYEWCEDDMGRKQGPYRSWFSTGRYLMQRGQYEDDAEIGEWLDCNRFESCKLTSYE
jgi:hypothetical protein